MTVDRNTKILMAVFTFALLLNGLNPWIDPPDAGARENTAMSGDNLDTDCSAARKNSVKSLEIAHSVKRLLGYVESSVNDIKLTVNGIDRKMNQLPSVNSSVRK